MFELLQKVLAGRPLELTHTSVDKFPWWLWLPTIGPISNEVIGDGIERIALAQTWSSTARTGYLGKAKFLIAHTDKTAVLLNAAHGDGHRRPYWFEDLEKDSDNYNWWVNWRL